MSEEGYRLDPVERPFQPPPTRSTAQPAPVPPVQLHSQAAGAFVPCGWKAKAIVGLLLAGALMDLLMGVIAYPTHQPLLAEARGEDVEDSAILMSAGIMVLGGLVMIAIYVTTVVFYCMWIHRAYSNLRGLGWSSLRYSPGWVVGYHFIPFLNLVRPCQAMADLWRGSEPDLASSDRDLLKNPITPMIGVWWALWIGSGVLGQVSFRLGMKESYDALHASMWIDIVNGGISAVCALLLLSLVRKISARQEQRFAALSGRSASPMSNWPHSATH